MYCKLLIFSLLALTFVLADETDRKNDEKKNPFGDILGLLFRIPGAILGAAFESGAAVFGHGVNGTTSFFKNLTTRANTIVKEKVGVLGDGFKSITDFGKNAMGELFKFMKRTSEGITGKKEDRSPEEVWKNVLNEAENKGFSQNQLNELKNDIKEAITQDGSLKEKIEKLQNKWKSLVPKN